MKRATTIVTALVLAAVGGGAFYLYRINRGLRDAPRVDAAPPTSQKKPLAAGELRPVASERKTGPAAPTAPAPVPAVAHRPASITEAAPDISKLEKWKA